MRGGLWCYKNIEGSSQGRRRRPDLREVEEERQPDANLWLLHSASLPPVARINLQKKPVWFTYRTRFSNNMWTRPYQREDVKNGRRALQLSTFVLGNGKNKKTKKQNAHVFVTTCLKCSRPGSELIEKHWHLVAKPGKYTRPRSKVTVVTENKGALTIFGFKCSHLDKPCFLSLFVFFLVEAPWPVWLLSLAYKQ